ncbi:hypothetical protein [Streptomyces sp. NPDC092370]|uniref:hypothetical protein n=1 Tax=Streptomyces sp. NPDC092370 TaxID=3366016 RepID=UPI0038213BB8
MLSRRQRASRPYAANARLKRSASPPRVDPFDRRRVLAHLTPRGREYRQRVDRAVRAGRPPLGDGDDELPRSLLGRLVTTLADSAHV